MQSTATESATSSKPTLVNTPSHTFAQSTEYPGRGFEVITQDGIPLEHFLQLDAYSAAMAFVQGQFTIRGDLFAAIRFFLHHPHSTVRSAWFSLAARLGHLANSLVPGSKARAVREIGFHYDRSNEFYCQFLDSRMQYSTADFSDPARSLEEAQQAKLDHICRALHLKAGERFLDVGCGWGGLITYAAERFGVQAVGCTLSQQQREFAERVMEDRGLKDRITIERMDYRDLEGRFDKISSVGMFEHVGRSRLPLYFERMNQLLSDDGLFLNRGIVRPEGVRDGPETLFLQRSVFPGGELVSLSEVLRIAGRTGFEVVRVEGLRLQYARTCREWVSRLQQNSEACHKLVDNATYRTWLLYLAASAVNFEDGQTDDVEIVFAKSPERHRRRFL